MERWPHQLRAVEQTLAAIAAGERTICLTSPTGGGKTRMACDLIEEWTAQGLKTALYTNRKLLVEQTGRVMDMAGIDHGKRAAGWQADEGVAWPVQVCSIQTEEARVFKAGLWQLHDADRVLIDEAHLQKGPVARKIINKHLEAGAAIIGLTATPIDLGDLYDHLLVCGTNSELRECGALVPALHYGPDEPAMSRGIRAALGEDLTEKQNVAAIMREGIFGRVMEWFDKLNPARLPTLLFAPGVAESLWFAQQFEREGITAAHIDGSDVYYRGRLHRSNQGLREEVLDASRTGAVVVLCNRFVCREGVDLPHLAHGIFATVFGSLGTYLQAGGRLLRAHPGIERVTIQDHGGNWWRHGSLNDDRQWNLSYSSGMISGLREDRLRGKKDAEPYLCQECGRVLRGVKCFGCGWILPIGYKKTRAVVQSDGQLKQMVGDIYRPRRISQDPNGPKLWQRMYYRSCTEKGSRSFRAAAALFAQENRWSWPCPTWPLMPKNELDWFRKVADVPREHLT